MEEHGNGGKNRKLAGERRDWPEAPEKVDPLLGGGAPHRSRRDHPAAAAPPPTGRPRPLRLSQHPSTMHRTVARLSPEIKRVGVIGLGLMGHGIAQTAAWEGFEVVGMEKQQDFIDAGRAKIEESVAKVIKSAEKRRPDTVDAVRAQAEAALGRISYATDLGALADCDIVIEAIVEDMNVKGPLYESLNEIVKADGILATNTSSLPVQLMAESSTRMDRTIGVHFFNPVQVMKLVEVVGLGATDPAVLDATVKFVEDIKKVPVLCKDTPGFVVNRLLVPYLAQAMLMLERGEASADGIDTAMKLGAGVPMGPLELSDYVGLDTALHILDGWVQDYPDEAAFVVPDILREKVREGKLGRKSGEGFFKWDGLKRL